MSARPARTRAGWESPGRLVVYRLRVPLALALGLFTVATVGFVLLTDMTWFDAVYMTVITLGTIGYGEVSPLDTVGRVWTIAVIAAGFAIVVYLTASLTSLFVSGDVRSSIEWTRRAKMRDQLDHHVIVVGFGRVGRAVVAATVANGRTCAVIDDDVSLADDVGRAGAVFVPGDGRELSVLREAHIEKADAVVSALDDPDNLVVVLSVGSLRPELRVAARVNDVTWSERLLRAGASTVVPVYESAGANLAASAVDTDIVAIQDLPTLGVRTEELVVPAGSDVIGTDLRVLAAELADVAVLGVRRDARIARWGEVEGGLAEGDVLVALGPPASVARLAALVGARPAAALPPQA